RVAAEDLNRDRPLLLGVLSVLQRAIDPAHEPLGADHLGHDETASAMTLDQTAERRVGHARHGSDDEGSRESDATYFHQATGLRHQAQGQDTFTGLRLKASGLDQSTGLRE